MTVATNSSAKTPHTTGVSGTRLLVALATSVGLSLGAGFATAYGLPLFSALGERRIGVLCRTRRLVPRRTTTNLGGSRRSFSSQPCLPSSVITVECLRFVRGGVQVLHPFTRFPRYRARVPARRSRKSPPDPRSPARDTPAAPRSAEIARMTSPESRGLRRRVHDCDRPPGSATRIVRVRPIS